MNLNLLTPKDVALLWAALSDRLFEKRRQLARAKQVPGTYGDMEATVVAKAEEEIERGQKLLKMLEAS